MTPEVTAAIDELRVHFVGRTILVGEDAQGGACVIIEDVEFGPPYTQTTSWVGFHITHGCPYADVYPHFVRGDLIRADGRPLGEAMGGSHQFPQPKVVVRGALPSRPAVQISRRSNHRETDSTMETPLIKLLKVLKWTRSR
jgi:hypothetical protein